MNWNHAPELIEHLLMYPLKPLELTKELYSENIFFWCNILPVGKSAVTLMPGLKLCFEFGCNDYRFQILRLLFLHPYEGTSVWVAYLTDVELHWGGARGSRPPLLLDLTEALRAEKKNSRPSPPPYLKVWISHCKVITDPLFAPFFFLLFFLLYFCTQLRTKIQKKGRQKL